MSTTISFGTTEDLTVGRNVFGCILVFKSYQMTLKMTPLSLSMLGDFGEEMQQTSSRMDSVLKKLEKVSHMTSSEWTWKIREAPQPKYHVTKTVSVPVRSQAVVRHRGPGCRHGCGPHPLLGPLMSVTRMDPRRGDGRRSYPFRLRKEAGDSSVKQSCWSSQQVQKLITNF